MAAGLCSLELLPQQHLVGGEGLARWLHFDGGRDCLGPFYQVPEHWKAYVCVLISPASHLKVEIQGHHHLQVTKPHLSEAKEFAQGPSGRKGPQAD